MAMTLVALALDIGEHNRPAVVGQIGRKERSSLVVGTTKIAHAVKGERGWVGRTTREPASFQPAILDGGIDQHIAQLGIRAKRTGQDVQAAARRSRHPVVLVAHVVIQGAMTLDEQNLVKVQQRIAQHDLAADATHLDEHVSPRLDHARVHAVSLQLQLPQLSFQRGQIGARQWVRSGSRETSDG